MFRLLVDQWIRPHYLSAVTHIYALTQNWAPAGAAWQLGSGVVAPGGGLLSMQDGSDIAANVPSLDVPRVCESVASQGQNDPGHVLSCMQSLGYRQYITYQPASRYWEFQGIEAVIFVALAAALIGVALAVVGRRDA